MTVTEYECEYGVAECGGWYAKRGRFGSSGSLCSDVDVMAAEYEFVDYEAEFWGEGEEGERG